MTENILNAVTEITGTTIEDIRGESRAGDLPVVRAMAATALHWYGLKDSDIASIINRSRPMIPIYRQTYAQLIEFNRRLQSWDKNLFERLRREVVEVQGDEYKSMLTI
jgi:hypothetical protein